MPPTATLGDLRAKVHSEAQSLLLNKWEVEDCIYPKPEAIGISADTHGFTAFETNSTRLGDICSKDNHFYALVPSRSAGAALPNKHAFKMSDCLTAPLHQKLKKEQEEKMALRAQHHAMEETLVARIDAIAEQVREKDKQAREKDKQARERDEQVNELNKRMEELVKQEREKEKREGERDKREGERDKREREKDEKLNELFEQGREKDEQISTLTQILYETRQSLSGADAESEWIVVGDTPRLDGIKLRNILDVAMARLAIAACLTDKLPDASIVWRDSLGTSADTVTRRAIAEGLLSREGLQLPESIQNLRKSRQGMDLVVEKYSKIRSRGDRVAHQARPIRALNDTAVQRSQIEGMGVVAEVAYDH